MLVRISGSSPWEVTGGISKLILGEQGLLVRHFHALLDCCLQT